MTSLAQKLSVTPGQIVCLLEAPADTAALLRRELPAAVLIEDVADEDRYEAIFFWPKTPEGLAERFALLACHIVPYGAVWAVLPKKQFAPVRGVALSWEQMQAAALQTDLVDNKNASISEVEYGTRFVIRSARRGAYLGDEGERR